MKNPAFRKEVPLKDIARSTKVLFKIAWETDKFTFTSYGLTAIIGGLITLAASWVLKLLIDQLQMGQSVAFTTIPIIVVFVLVARYLVGLVQDLVYTTYHQNYLDYLLRYQLQNAITKRFVQKISHLDIAHFENPKTQDLISRVRGTMKSQLADMMRLIGAGVRDLIGFLAAFIVLLPFGWWMPILVTIVTIPRLYLRSKYGALQWSLWGAGAPQMRKLWYYDHLFSNPVAVREMRISGSAPALLQKFEQIQDHLLDLSKGALKKYVLVSVIPPLLETALIVVIAYTFLDDVLRSALSIGSFTLLVNMLSQVNSRAASVSTNFGRIYEKGLYLYNFSELLAIPPLLPRPKNGASINPLRPPRIEFCNVSFRYPDGPEVLRDVSFVIEPGQSVALVGDNGAGKSTIINLLCRFYDASAGQILIDGTDIRDIELSSWFRLLGILFQKYVHYHFTIRENIAFQNSTAAVEADLEAAARKSGAHDFIIDLPAGYEQQLGREFENGVELSGGQWQKLAIARAFYNQPPVLILDEPTSAIDAESEYAIFTNLEELYENKTLILVSHRFSTVRNADIIYVIDQGRIIERGNHDVLLEKNGKYAMMFRAQAKGYQ